MKVIVSVTIKAPKEKIWKQITDIERAPEFISAIDRVEILDRGKEDFTGFTWKETRTMFGKEADETMTVTEARENGYYITRAGSHGSVYITTVKISPAEGGNELSMELVARPQTFGARILSLIFGILFRGATRRAILQDLEEIKEALEAG